MPKKLACDNDLCRDPFNQKAYVVFDNTVNCLQCYLVWELGVDAEEAVEITFEGGKKDEK